MTAEEKRLAEAQAGKVAWRRWGHYLSERQRAFPYADLVQQNGRLGRQTPRAR